MRNKFYLKEFQYWDGEAFVTFDIVNLDSDRKTITVAVSNRGKISVIDYTLLEDEKGLYFEYGVDYTKIAIDDFTEVSDDETF